MTTGAANIPQNALIFHITYFTLIAQHNWNKKVSEAIMLYIQRRKKMVMDQASYHLIGQFGF